MNFRETLFIHLQCNFPLIYIETVEIDRATEVIKKVVEDFNKWLPMSKTASKILALKGLQVLKWDIYNGLVNLTTNEVIKNTNQPIAFLDYVLKRESPFGVYIVENFHLNWEDGRLPMYVAMIKTIYNTCKSLNKHLLFISPNLKIPNELKDFFSVMSFSLPNYEERLSFILSEVNARNCKVNKKEIEKVAELSSGMTINEIENAISIALAQSKGTSISPEIISIEKANVVKRSGLLEIINIEHGLEMVGGLFKFKDWAVKVSKVFNNLRRAIEYKLPMPKGCLIFGISGTGKSLLAKSLAKEFKVPLYRADVGKLFGSLVGETEANTRELFKLIEVLSPCVILFDEIEKLFSGLESSSFSDSGTTARMIGNFLYYMQEKTIPAYFVATANNVYNLAPELLRAGRWDEIWFVDLPSFEERLEIFKIHISKVGRNIKKFKNIELMAHETEGYTGAEIENIVKTAMFNAFYEDREFNEKDIFQSIRDIKPISRLKAVEIDNLRKWAEHNARKAN